MQLFQMAHMHKLIDYFYVVIASTISSLVKSYWWVLLYPYFFLQLLILHRQASRKCLNLQTGFGARKGLRCQSRPMDPLHLDSDTGKRHIGEIFVSSPKESMMTLVVNGGWAVAHPPILRLPKRSDKVSITAAKRTGLRPILQDF